MTTIKVYGLVDPTSNHVRYIGLTKRSLNVRLSEHLKEKHRNKRCSWIQSLKKRGFRPEIILVDEVVIDPDFWEQHYISLFSSFGFKLVNGTLGGLYGAEMPSEIRKKLSEAKKRYKFTPAHIANIQSASAKRRGTKLSPEHVAKVVAKRKGKKLSEQIKRKIGESHIGIRPSAETRKKQSAVCKHKRPVLQIDNTLRLVKEWGSIKEAADIGGFKRSYISECANLKKQTYRGYFWRFK